jgi:GNAT superfamily N-acetyltransferase
MIQMTALNATAFLPAMTKFITMEESIGMTRLKKEDFMASLVYCDNEIVGWCNANTKSDCQECMHAMRTYSGVPVAECLAEEKIKFIFCFVIAPKWRKMGIATKLLRHICKDAATDGFDYVEARTNKNFIEDGFKGPLALYEKCGFSIYATQGDNVAYECH